MKKQLGLAAIGLAGLTAGAGAGLVLTGGSGGASAQSSPTTTPDTTAPANGSNGSSGTERPAGKDLGARLNEILAPLVQKGTISQAQADAVIAAIEAARPADGPHGGFGRGPGGPGKGFGLDEAAAALGMTADQLRTALAGGQSLADVAKAKGVDLTKVTDALVAAYTKHEQDEVTAGSETQAEADKEIAAFKDKVDEIVNGTFKGRHDQEQAPTTTTP
ncbi:MAG TPA: hypothetical protein VF076_05160 [Acidimicrobiales bacterium]